MQAVRFHTTGAADVLVLEEIADPVPAPGEVLVRVEAVGLNFADVMRRRGDDYPEPSPPPFVLGAEVAGTVAALGEGVTSVAVGDAVFATPGAGGYAQYVAVPAAAVIPLPLGMSAVEAAALVAHGLTAAIVLRQVAKLASGETVLVEGAAGGLGSFAVQLARAYGAGLVVAAASTPEKRAAAERLGAHASVDYTDADWAAEVRRLTDGRGVDVVLETTGGETVGRALEAMADFGRMIYIGQSSGRPAAIDPWRLTATNQTVTGFYIGAFTASPELVVTTLQELLGHIAEGRVALQIGTVLPLAQAAEAHRLLEGRRTTGKVVLLPWADPADDGGHRA